VHPSQFVWALVVGPIIGVVAIAWVRLIARAAQRRPVRHGRFLAPLVVFGALGVVSIRYPQLLGNGKGIVQLEALGGLSFGLLCVLLILKPLATAGCLAAGAPGGLFTPTLSVGVLLAGVLGMDGRTCGMEPRWGAMRFSAAGRFWRRRCRRRCPAWCSCSS
jgi:chloride channel protein, CIC family